MAESDAPGNSTEDRILRAREYIREYMRRYRELPGKRERHNELSRQSKARKRAGEAADS